MIDISLLGTKNNYEHNAVKTLFAPTHSLFVSYYPVESNNR